MEWTKEQKRIIDLRSSNILVSAAAGSGKTAVLVERILNLIINDNEDIDRFLIVTFTNAAASTMKQKIQKSLLKAVQVGGKDLVHLRKQLSLLNKSQISTIHSFCLDVVRKNFHIIGIDPDFRIQKDNERAILIKESLDEVLERAYESDSENFRVLVESFTSKGGDEDLCDLIERTYNFLLSFPDPMEWLEKSVESLDTDEEKLKSSPWIKSFSEQSEMLLRSALENIEEALKICDDEGIYFYEAALLDDRRNISDLIETARNSFGDFYDRVRNISYTTAGRKKKTDEIDPSKQAEVKALRDEAKDIIKYLAENTPNRKITDYVMEIKDMHGPMCAMMDVIKDLDVTYLRKKIEKGVVDYNDLEHYALKILRDETVLPDGSTVKVPSEIAQSYRKKFRYIFVDEYQDSNSIQETIISQIKGDDNLFMVGDVKQSIYRFRLADPGIFNGKYKSFAKDSEGLNRDIRDRRVDLSMNFRSRNEILEGTNTIFRNIMSEELGEIEYGSDQYLNCGAGAFPGKGAIELCFIDKKGDGEGTADEEIKLIENSESEALFVAQKIRGLLAEETYVLDKGELRKIQYRDIVILMRSVVGRAAVFEDIFGREKIPFYFEGGSGYFETVEIQVMMNLLRLIDNIKQDVPLLSVMRSPIGGFTTDEIVKIRVHSMKGSYYGALSRYMKSGDDKKLSEKLESFVDRMSGWNFRSKYSKLDDLIWEILIETNYYYFVGVLPNGEMRQANLRLLSDKAHEFESTSMRGLYNFLRYVEKINVSSGDAGTAKTLGENDNVVRLMTIHTSKGLEFPVVFLCGTGNGFNKTDESQPILKHKEFGIAPKYVNPSERIFRETIPRMAIKNKINRENLSEEMRILYVAMTRAVDKLIIVGTLSKYKAETYARRWHKGPSKYRLLKAESFLDWIGASLFNMIDVDEITEMMSGGTSSDGVWKFSRISLADLIEVSSQSLAESGMDLRKEKIEEIIDFKNKKNSEYSDEIDRRLSYRYSHEKSVNVPTKISVTKLNRLEKESFEKLYVPALRDMPVFSCKGSDLSARKDFSASEKGTLVHFVMQHLDLGKNLGRTGIEEQIADMEHRNLLTTGEAMAVTEYSEKIEEFFLSEIGRRMISSPLVRREVPFVIKRKASDIAGELDENDVVLVQGIVDCLFYEDGEAVIVDYKTDSVTEEEIENVRDEYREQVLSYKDAVEKITHTKVKECSLYLFSLSKTVKI